MGVTTTTEFTDTQISSTQTRSLFSSSGTFRKQSFEHLIISEVSFCDISFSDFEEIYKLKIINILWDELSDQIAFKLEYKSYFTVHLKLNGYWELEDEQKFHLTDVDWLFEEKENSPTSAFVLDSFKIMLGLSDKVKVDIPSIDYWFRVLFPLEPNRVSEILKIRQLAYRLMLIEKAFMTKLPFPRRFITGEEIENIAFCYYAIVERTFEWVCNNLTFFPISDRKNIKLLPPTNTPFPLLFPTNDEKRILFGKSLNLKQFYIRIDQALIINYDEAKQKSLSLDGNPFEVKIKSINGKMEYEAINTPSLPQSVFNSEVEKLIELDQKIDNIYFEKYLDSFSDAFEGLTIKEIQAITERPILEEEAFNF